jgi:ABC superfamily ATP binding cassette transporter, ABC protein
MEEQICEIRNLGLHYQRGGRAVLKGLSLSFHKGEILGIRGENGAGKSTLLKALAGLLPYAEGEIRFAPKVQKELSYLPQDLSLYESLTAMENLYFYGKIQGLPKKVIFTRATWLLRELGLEEKAGERLSALSGGMKRRVHLASALMKRPAILLLDEPTVGCDNESYERILSLLRKMKAQGTAMLLISHGRGELEEMADRIVYLEDGKIRE